MFAAGCASLSAAAAISPLAAPLRPARAARPSPASHSHRRFPPPTTAAAADDEYTRAPRERVEDDGMDLGGQLYAPPAPNPPKRQRPPRHPTRHGGVQSWVPSTQVGPGRYTYCMADIARHVIRCRFTQGTRATRAFSDLAGSICQALGPGSLVRLKARQGRGVHQKCRAEICGA